MTAKPDQSHFLKLEDVTIALNGKTLVSVDGRIDAGDILTVMGPSGSGKSTLLAYVSGFLDPVFDASGKVWLGNEDVTLLPAEQRHAGLLFQDPLLFPHMSIGQNLLFAIPSKVRGKARRIELARSALSQIELDDFFDRDPATLSGGQKTRVALARVLLSEPRALLLDEPFSRLDQGLRSQIRALVFEMAKRHHLPLLMVTHDMQDAEEAGGRLITIGID